MLIRRFPRRVPAAALLLLFLIITAAGSLPAVPAGPLESITKRELRAHLEFLTSKELGGRFTFSEGNRTAARYLAEKLASYGYKGAARDGSFFQPIGFVSKSLNRKDSRLQILRDDSKKGREFRFGEDFFTNEPLPINLASEVVFVGYGISAPETGHDDYKEKDLKGKIALIALGTPKEFRSKAVKDEERGLAAAMAHGALAALFIHPLYNGKGWEKGTVYEDEALKMAGEPDDSISVSVLPNAYAGRELSKALLLSAGIEFEDLMKAIDAGEPLAQKGLPVKVRFQIVMNENNFAAQNIAGKLEGSDPQLKKEYLMLSAHYDHLESSGKTIFPGADDDGSGVSSVLAIARALAMGSRPKRSILIVFHTGEEIGLYGSRYFTEIEPLVPLDSIVAVLNVDMIGRSRLPGTSSPQDKGLTDIYSVYLIGSDKHSSELHSLSEHTNQEFAKMRLDYTYNDEKHPLKLFYRSDHYNYALKGIPVIFYFTGLHADYHRPTDTIEKIDFEKMTRIARFIYATAWRVANLDRRPAVDKWKKS